MNQAPKKAPWWNPAKWFAVRREIPIEQRSYTRIYAILSMLLFAFTVWAVLDEAVSRRPWKDIQADFKEFKTKRLELVRHNEIRKIPVAVRKEVLSNLKKAKSAMESDKYLNLAKKLNDMDSRIADEQRDYTFIKSRADEAYYTLDEARIHRADTVSYSKNLRELEEKMNKQNAIVEADTAARGNFFRAQLMPYQRTVKQAQNVHDSVFANVIAIDRKIEAVANQKIEIHQTILFNYDMSNFGNQKLRVDRCETCHLSYDDPLFKNDTLVSTDKVEISRWLKSNEYNDKHYKIKKLGANKDTVIAVVTGLFRIHPDVANMIKKHRLGDPAQPGVLVCSSCHQGQGMSIVSPDFAHGFEPHWEQPLLTGHYVEASCQNCHSSKFDFEGAKYITMGKKLFVDFGCYGCHTMPGMETWTGQGPSLINVSKKLTPSWIYQWIKNPRGWAHDTRMPNFVLSDHEASAITAYIIDQSKQSNYVPLAHNSGGGDIARGKQTFFDAGCVACHSIDEYKATSRIKEGNSFGPNLDKEGSKVTAEWLFDWIKNPKNYQAHSRMPSLRLSDQEASDLTAYVISHTGVNDSSKAQLSVDISSTPLVKEGEKLIKSYGCFGCHEINGMEKEGKVSVALSNFAKKTPHELFYGDINKTTFAAWRKMFEKADLPLGEVDEAEVHDNQDWYTWIVGKMMNSRIYQTERIAQRMPDFQMSKEEAYALSVFLRSQSQEYVSPGYADPADDPIQQGLDKGRLFAHWNNCVGCHKIENSGGLVSTLIHDKFGGDPNIAYFDPPFLGPEGSRVQESWLHTFLQGPTKIRPLVKMRMPSFGFSDGEISTATNYFLSMHQRQLVMTNYEYTVNSSIVPHGKELFDKLKCLSCHYVGTTGEALAKAPNLANVKKRIRPEWIASWLSRPDSVMPGTPMTSFWISGGKLAPADPTILGGDYKMQIHAVKDFLESIGSDAPLSATPYAVINGSAKYVLPNGDYEAAMARTEIPTATSLLAKPTVDTKKTSSLFVKKKGRKFASR